MGLSRTLPSRSILTFAALLLVVASCAREPAPSSFAPRSADSLRAFESARAGYRFELPTRWVDHSIAVDFAPEDLVRDYPRAFQAVRFEYLPGESVRRREPLLTLIAYEPDHWDTVTAAPGLPVGVPIMRSDRVVVVAAVPSHNPYDPSSPDAERYAQLMPSWPELRQRLRFAAPADSAGEPRGAAAESLHAALETYLKGSAGDSASLHPLALADLDDDGVDDGLVLLEGVRGCGPEGCVLLVFRCRAGHFEFRSRITAVRPPVLLTDQRTRGWRDLVIRTMTVDGAPKDVVLHFDGNAYPPNATLLPLRREAAPPGRILFAG
jgi:hypothetical protein